MKFKKTVGVAITAACCLFLANAAQAQINEHNFRFSTAGAVGHPIVTGGDKWAELVKAKSGGKMTIKVFPGGQLGGDVQVLSAVQGGTVDFTSMNSGILQGLAKEFAVFDFPFMFNDGKEADGILDGAFGKKMGDLVDSKGLVHLAYWELGFRQLSNSKREVKSLDDIAGLKIRVIQSPIYLDTFNALGANAVPMPFTELYTALEQKMIDGQENPFSVIESSKINEVQKFLTITNHIYNPQSLLASKKTWEKLTKDEQALLLSTAMEARTFQRNHARELAEKSLANLKKTMTVSTMPPAEVAKIRAKLKPVIDKFGASVGAETVAALQAELDKGRK